MYRSAASRWDPRSASDDRLSAHYGRAWPWSVAVDEPCAPPAAALRTPGHSSLREPGAGRYTDWSACLLRPARRVHPKSWQTWCAERKEFLPSSSLFSSTNLKRRPPERAVECPADQTNAA